MIFEIFQYDFMIRAFLAGIMIAIIAPSIGMFLVVRRLSLTADTLAHVSLVGIAAGLLLHIHPLLGALIASIFATIGIETLRKSKKIFGESALAIFLSGSLALAAILLGFSRQRGGNIMHFLFGSITTIDNMDIILISLLGVIVLITVALFYKEFFLISFDEELAEAQGIRVKLFNSILMFLTAITVSLSLRIVGVLLIGALMVIPVVTATLLRKSFKQTIFLSVMLALISVIAGIILSFKLNMSTGGTIVFVALILFVIFFFGAGKKR